MKECNNVLEYANETSLFKYIVLSKNLNKIDKNIYLRRKKLKLAARKFTSFLIMCCVICFALVAFFGIHSKWGDVVTPHFKGWQDLSFGLDFNAHNELLLEPTDKDISVNDTKILKTLNDRLNIFGITDKEISVDKQNNQLLLKYSQPASDPTLDAKAICKVVGQKGELNLTMVDGKSLRVDETYSQQNFVNKSDLKNAEIVTRQLKKNSKPEIGIKLNFKKSSFKKLADLTNELLSHNEQIRAQNLESEKNEEKDKKSPKKLLISIDGIDLEAKEINTPITNGQIEIFNNFNIYNATMAIDFLNTADLPTYLELLQITQSTPKLGLWFKRELALVCLAILFIAIAVLMFKFGLIGAICGACFMGHLGLMMACFTGFFKIYPGVIFNFAALVGCSVSAIIGIISCFVIAKQIQSHAKINPKNLFALSVKSGISSSLPLINSMNIKLIFSSIVLMAVFGTKTNAVSFLLNPIFDIFDFVPLFNSNISSFAYAIFVGGLGGLIFENMIFKFIVNPITSPEIKMPNLNLKKLTNIKNLLRPAKLNPKSKSKNVIDKQKNNKNTPT